MHLSIRNYVGIITAEIDIKGVTALYGKNNQGKSSTLNALTAALTGIPLPKEVTKANAGVMITDGAEAGMILLTGDTEDDTATIRYPKATVDLKGRAPFATQMACGQTSLVDMDAATRAQTLIDLLKARPTIEELALGMELDVDSEPVKAVWKRIEDSDWDSAHRFYVERGTKLKGAWKEITGGNYGTAKAPAWLPDGWTPDLDLTEVPALEKALVVARSLNDGAVATRAIGAAERVRREQSAGNLDNLISQADAANAEILRLEAAHDDARIKRASLVDPGHMGHTCPHCSKHIRVDRDAAGEVLLTKVETGSYSPDEVKAMRKAIASASGAESAIAGNLGTARRNFAALEAAVLAARADKEWLEANPADAVEDNSAQIAEIQKTITQAENRLAMRQIRDKALARHHEIIANQDLIELLAPTGLRQKKLGAVLSVVNSQLESASTAMKWPVVSIDADLNVLYGKRPYGQLLAASERWRVRAVLQLILAKLDRSQVVILDGADILMDGHRSALFVYLADYGLPSVVGVSVPGPSKAWDLEDLGYGIAYWIQAGVAQKHVAIKQEG